MTVAAGIAFCQRYLGFPYSIAPSRFGLTRPVHFDCSGYAWRYCDEAGTPLPASVSTTFAMVAYAEDNPDLGLTVTREYAVTNAGVLCLRGGRVPSGKNGSGGHMAISDGAGGTYEAQSTRTGVVRGVIGNRFDFFMVPPGYGITPLPPEDKVDDMILFLRDATEGGAGDTWAVVGGRPIYLDTPRAQTEMQNIALTFGQDNIEVRDTDPNVLRMLGCWRS